jgi:Zn-dependent protease/predicted transcriptional regulator
MQQNRTEDKGGARRAGPMEPRGLRVGQIAGVAIWLDWSLLIIFALITLGLGGGLFPYWHPDWPAWTTLLTALAAAALFLVSVLLHELSHALVGRMQGTDIRRITLFIFGGMAHMEAEPATWRSELAMAIAGPVTSLVIGGACLWIGGLLAGPIQLDPENPVAVMSGLGPLATLLFWLGPINILLGLFNLVPGFPLDGGRVLRSLLWGATGDLTRATLWASSAGQLVAWTLIGIGFAMILGVRVPFFGTGVLGGLWLALIGWFLNNAAILSYRRQLVAKTLGDLPVSQVMNTQYQTVGPAISIQDLVENHLMRGSQRAYPVLDQRGLLGMICLEDVRRLARAQWAERRVEDVMTPAARLHTVPPDEDASAALDLLAQKGINQVPVVDNGRPVGIVSREDILKWLKLHEGSEADLLLGGR